MRRFILTGAPGSGKTAILRQLELEGFSVVEEAATDIIAASQNLGIPEPWRSASFIDDIVQLQRARQLRASQQSDQIQFHDRSVICTAALANFLGYGISPTLSAELELIRRETIFERQVFFIRNLGFITNTEARRITFEETLRFEKVHEQIYRAHGFELVYVDKAPLQDRVAKVRSFITTYNSP
ncbi:AAA family ATPase [Occallatibacter savannae]|uniref:AAA family ATPase n=1 Tax=Occallatibacter savannae TaxID=1002691 RepID=UPI000D693851|nr:AAA family ATPase [Occallatibacter savannae]